MLLLQRSLLATLALSILCTLGAQGAWGQRRVALVIGNSAYKHASALANPRNDAVDLAAVLKRLDFEVVEGHDLDKASMDRTIRNFAEKLAGSQLALFFYAGHGLQVGGQNYLVPVDAELNTAAALDFETVRLDLVHRTMERETTTNIFIIDACRDNPLARNLARALGTRSASVGRGLAAMESGEGTLISFSTQPGNVALDGRGRNSPYAAALLKHLPAPGEDLPTILINVRNDVMAATERRQVPWEHSALTARVYFTPPKPAAPSIDRQIELSFWDSVKDSQVPAVLQTYIDRFPDGEFAPIARALIEHYMRQAEAAEAERAEVEKRREEARKAAEIKRLEEERRAKEEALAAERRRAAQLKDAAAAKAAQEKAQAEARARDDMLRKALAEAAAAREEARKAAEQHAAALKAAEEAKHVAAQLKEAAAARAAQEKAQVEARGRDDMLRKALAEAAAAREEARKAAEEHAAALKAAEESKRTAAKASETKRGESTSWENKTKVAALPKLPPPSAPGGPFDGTWLIQVTGGNCPNAGAKFAIQIVRGNVTGAMGHKGQVSEAGSITWGGRSRFGPVMIRWRGTLQDNKGSGTYGPEHRRCSGTFTATRQ